MTPSAEKYLSSISSSVPALPPAFVSTVRKGSQLVAGVSYRLEQATGDAADVLVPGRYYFATEVEEKAGRLMVDMATGFAFNTDSTDIWSE